METNVYTENGYKNREEYLRDLALDYGLSFEVVKMIANLLGENEDFDGLVTTLQDVAEMNEDYNYS